MPSSLAPSSRVIALPTALVVGGLAVAIAGGLLAGPALIPLIIGVAATALGSTRLAYSYATYLSLERRIIAKLDMMTAKTPDEMRSYVVNGRLNLPEALKIATSYDSLERKTVLGLIKQALLEMGKCLEAASATPQADDDTASVANEETDRLSLISSDSSDSTSSAQRPASPPREAWDLSNSTITLDLE